MQLVHQRLQPVDAQVQLLDQPHGLVAAAHQSPPGGAPLAASAGCLLTAIAVVAAVLPSRCSSVARFGPSRFRMFRFFSVVLVTETSIVRSSRSLPSRTFRSRVDRALQQIVAGQHGVAEARASALDLLGGRDLLRSRLASGSRPSASGTCAPDRRSDRSRPRYPARCPHRAARPHRPCSHRKDRNRFDLLRRSRFPRDGRCRPLRSCPSSLSAGDACLPSFCGARVALGWPCGWSFCGFETRAPPENRDLGCPTSW